MSPFLAHRDILRRRTSLIATGAIAEVKARASTQEGDARDLMYGPRALQEDFVELAAAVLHQCIRPQIGVCCAPGHHGYQRACVLITGQASIGPFGSPVFACAGKTDPPFLLILSQTSAGNC
jgi:hypothetical protein